MTVVKRWLPVALMCLFIYVSSSLPGAKVSDVGSVDVFSHKVAHLFLYFLLCLCFFRATKQIIMAVVLTVLYGITDEYHQLFVITRSGSYMDVFVDTVGALISGVVLWKFYQNLPQKLKNWLEE